MLGGQGASSGSGNSRSHKRSHKALPPLFWYMEMGDFEKAAERARRHPREVRTWATLRTKSMADAKVSGTKRLALHHACFKLRSIVPNSSNCDSFVQVCKFIMLLIELYPAAAGMRESRHGCLPLHLASFASCAPRPKDESSGETPQSASKIGSNNGNSGLSRPLTITTRSTSESTSGSHNTNMSAIFAEEKFTGTQTADLKADTPKADTTAFIQPQHPSVSLKSNVMISAKREDTAVKVINALLDAYPKGIRVDSEGGRLPLHTACAGRATPRVISTLITAYPAAARHRNKDGFLPLHLAAHWGVSHPNVAIALLRAYPDSTLGRNRWERTPLEEALCMAGENGRPHQAALVRALRKHPNYWTSPPEDLFRSTTLNERLEGPRIVDTDATLPDDMTSLEDEERRYFNSGHSHLIEDESEQNGGLIGRISPRGKSSRGETDLHHMLGLSTLIKNQNWNSVLRRVEQNPHEAGEPLQAMTRGGFISTQGLTPLHYACERRPPLEVVEALIAAWPEAVTTRLQPGGALPLHIVCTWNGSINAVTALTHAEPAACRIPDDLGNIPLHCAAFSGAVAPAIEVLLRTYAKSVLARNHQGSLASDIVKRLRHENRRSIMALLTSSKDEVLKTHHQRSRSSGSTGSCAAAAQRAMELNDIGPPPKIVNGQQILSDREEGQDVDLDAGVEVTYEDDEEGKDNLQWI